MMVYRQLGAAGPKTSVLGLACVARRRKQLMNAADALSVELTAEDLARIDRCLVSSRGCADADRAG
jgi:hypothetical protein